MNGDCSIARSKNFSLPQQNNMWYGCIKNTWYSWGSNRSLIETEYVSTKCNFQGEKCKFFFFLKYKNDKN